MTLLHRLARHVGALVVALGLGTVATSAAAGELLIETELADDGALLVGYTLPAGQPALRRLLDNETARQVWRDHVRAADACTEIDGELLRLRTDLGCSRLRVRVAPALLARYATYEPAAPIADTGLLAYSSYYAAALPGHGLRWRWLAPHGGYVMYQGRVERRAAELKLPAGDVDALLARLAEPDAFHAIGGSQYVYLGRAPLIEIPGGVLVRDPRLDEQRLAEIRHMLHLAMHKYGRAYGRMPNGPVGVVASTAELPRYRGEVSEGRVMGLWVTRTPEANRQPLNIQRFIAHEAAHWWNQGVYQSAELRPWLHEGHADWLALLLLREGKLIDDGRTRATIEAALNRCLVVRGQRPAATLPTGFRAGDDPYACGMSLMLMAQAQQLQRRPGTAALPLLAELHRGRREPLDARAFAAWADGGPQGPMRELLDDARLGFADGLVARLAALGLVETLPLDASAELAPALRAPLAGELLRALVAADCGNEGGFRAQDDGTFKLDGALQCASLRAGLELVRIGPHRLADAPVAAWREVDEACAAGRNINIEYRRGSDTALACPPTRPALPTRQLLRLTSDALKRLGLT